MPPPASPPPAFRWAALALAPILVYLPSLFCGFIWDDDRFLTRNPLILAANGLWRFWFAREAPDYFPLTSTTLWIEWRLWGERPFGFHLTNIFLHAGSALMAWRILAALRIRGAWLAALVFAVHPAAVQSVTWITERKNTLSLFLALAALRLWLEFDDRRSRNAGRAEQPGPGSALIYAGALILFAAALLSKTSIVALPVVMLGCVWARRGKIARADFLAAAPFFAAAAVLSLVTIWFQYSVNIKTDIVRSDSLASRAAGAGWALWFYLSKLVIPYPLIFVYPRWTIPAASPLAYLPLAAWAALLAAAWRGRGGWSGGALLALGAYTAMLLPVLGFLNIYFMRYSLVSDHWQYPAMLAPLAWMGAVWASWDEKTAAARSRGGGPDRRSSFSPLPAPPRLFAAGAVALLAALTWRQQGDYQSEETLWRATLRKNPAAALANNNLAVIERRKGDLETAARLYQKAVETDPDYHEAYLNLGEVRMEQGRPREALALFEKSLALAPNRPGALNNSGNALKELGRLEEAAGRFEKALALQPRYPDALSNLGSTLVLLGRTMEGVARVRAALEIEPRHAAACNNLGMAFASRKKFAEAIPWFRRSIEIAPNNAAARFNLASAYHLSGGLERAIAEYDAALRLNPRLEAARQYRAEALRELGRPESNAGSPESPRAPSAP